MAQAGGEPAHDWSGPWADTFLALALGPLVVWLADIAEGLQAGLPRRGLYGTTEAVTAGLVSSFAVYLVAFVCVRALLEVPRLLCQLLWRCPVAVPQVLTGTLAILALLWLRL